MSADSGKVAVFRLRPHGPLLWAAVVLLLGGVGLAALLRYAGDDPHDGAPALVLSVSVAMSGLCVIGATSKFWFVHLHPHRKPRHRRRPPNAHGA